VARGSRYRPALTAVYALLILAGVCTHVFFWTLFAVHMIWTLANAWGERFLPDLCRAQFLTLVLGSPLIAFAGYQSGNTVADLSGNFLVYLAEFLPFAFALPSANSGFFSDAVPFTGNTIFMVLRGMLLAVAVLLLAKALQTLWKTPGKSPGTPPTSSASLWWKASWLAGAGVATLAILGFVYMTRQLPPDQIRATIRLTRALTILPFTFAVTAFLLDRFWGRLPEPTPWKRLAAGPQGLLMLAGILPVVFLGTLTQFRPILNQRGLLFVAPYLLLLLSIGLLSLRPLWIGLAIPLLSAMCIASCLSYGAMTVDPADYTQFGTTLRSSIHPSDLVFVRKAWYATPILYYLPADRFRLVGRDYAGSCAGDPHARVWVVLLYDAAPAGDMQSALAGYHAIKTITAPHAKAILYEPAGSAS
jgi:hypothetical protein